MAGTSLPKPQHAVFVRVWPLVVLSVVALTGFVLMVGLEGGTQSDCDRVTQLQLQFAWTSTRVDAVLACWGPKGRVGVVAGLYADFVFLVGYSPLLALLVLRAGRRLAAVGPLDVAAAKAPGLALAQLAAGALDAVENFLLLGILQFELTTEWAPVVGLTAVFKFGLVLTGLVYLAAAVVICGYRRRVQPKG